jgi:4-amino-4-deoxy-L-arabinose transferase-like glycosyltransferase
VTPATPRPPARRRLPAALLWAGALVALFWNLGGGSLREWDEGLTAERAREMLVTGDWLTPRFQGRPDFQKPPLYYWLTAVGLRVLGPDELPVRLWSALLGVGVLGCADRLARAAAGSPRAGHLAVLLLATNPHWVNRTREGLLDSGLMLGLLGTAFVLLHRTDRAGAPLAAGGLAALGALVKGPFVLLGFLVPAWEFTVVRPRPGWWRPIPGALGVLAVLALPWYAAQVARWGPAYLEFHLQHNVLGRLVEGLPEHPGGPLYYVTKWAERGTVSLAALAAAAGVAAWRAPGLLRRHSTFLVLALAVLTGLSLAASKRDEYLVWVFPPAAVATAGLLDAGLARLGAGRRRAAALAVAGGLALALPFFARHYQPTLDLSRGKGFGLAVREAAGPDDLVLTVGLPVNTVLFYSGRAVERTEVDRLGEALGQAVATGRRRVLVVVPRDRLDPALARVAPPWTLDPRPLREDRRWVLRVLTR